LQTAMERTPLRLVKIWIGASVILVGAAASIAELVIAFHAFRWWAILVFCGFGFLPNFIFPGRNPAPVFFIGLLTTIIGTALILWR